MTIREIEEKYSHPIGILGDLQGPKLRVRMAVTVNCSWHMLLLVSNFISFMFQ